RFTPTRPAPSVASTSSIPRPAPRWTMRSSLAFEGRSYTGEDLVELSTHGGLLVPAAAVVALVAAGARPARPGEFTRRAVLNGKVDLRQAEATADLIDADSPAQARRALHQLDRALSTRLDELGAGLLEREARIAHALDA